MTLPVGGSTESGKSSVPELGALSEVSNNDITRDQIDMLGDDDEKPPAKEDLTLDDEGSDDENERGERKDKTPQKEDQEDEEEDETDDEKTETDEDDELNKEDEDKEEKVPESRVSFKEIKAKYPEFFKQFPEVREIMAKEYRFSQYFPTVDDAKEAHEKVQGYDIINDSMGKGEAKPFIDHFKKNPSGFDAFLNNFVKELRTNHSNDYTKITFPAIKQVLLASYQDGKGRNDNDLRKASLIVARNIWGEEYRNVLGGKEEDNTPKKSERETELEEQLEESRKVQESSFENTVYTKSMETLGTILNNGFVKAFKDKKSEFFGKNLTKLQRDAIQAKSLRVLGATLNKDKAHTSKMISLRQKAQRAGFAGEWTARVIDAYLAGAKNLLPTIQQRLIADEFKSDKPVENNKQLTKTGGSKRTGSPVTGKDNLLKALKKGEITDEQFLAGD